MAVMCFFQTFLAYRIGLSFIKNKIQRDLNRMTELVNGIITFDYQDVAPFFTLEHFCSST